MERMLAHAIPTPAMERSRSPGSRGTATASNPRAPRSPPAAVTGPPPGPRAPPPLPHHRAEGRDVLGGILLRGHEGPEHGPEERGRARVERELHGQGNRVPPRSRLARDPEGVGH